MERFDNTRKFVWETVIKNNRLEAYKKYIEYAKENKYKICGLEEFYREKDENIKHFILRHDVDSITPATRKMFECEKELGVKSTWYFRMCTLDKKLIDEMIHSGFEVGFHYETLANYCIEKKENSFNNNELGIVRERLI